ncbi:hypothetical protein N665_0647s0004 [Sinapis alba]|nr:hypothetical protein N665_0647s0004 [Sinapis alba]
MNKTPFLFLHYLSPSTSLLLPSMILPFSSLIFVFITQDTPPVKPIKEEERV